MPTTVRLPPRVEQALTSYCIESHKTKSEVIIEALEQRFAQPLAEKTPYELALGAGFIGCHIGSTEDQAETGNYKARAKAAIQAKHANKSGPDAVSA